MTWCTSTGSGLYSPFYPRTHMKKSLSYRYISKTLALLVIVAFQVLSTTTLALAAPLDSIADQVTAMKTILAELKVNYGMIKYKEKTLGITYEGLEKKYEALITSATTLEEKEHLRAPQKRTVLSREEFEQLMIGLASDLHDGHTNVTRKSLDYWTVGIHTAEVEGKLYVTGFEPKLFVPGSSLHPIAVGDEIIEVDGRPVAELARENSIYAPSATYRTRYQFGLESILNVSGKFMRSKRAGEVVRVKFRTPSSPNGAAAEFEGRYNWINLKDKQKLERAIVDLHPKSINQQNAEPSDYSYGERGTPSYFLEGLKALPPGKLVDIGALVNLQIQAMQAQILKNLQNRSGPLTEAESFQLSYLQPVTRLQAFTLKLGNATIGIIRIPDYHPASIQTVLAEILWSRMVVQSLEQNTDGLIIDQNTNGGGYVYEAVEMMRLFASKELKSVTTDYKLSRRLLIDTMGQIKESSDAESATRDAANLPAIVQGMPNSSEFGPPETRRKNFSDIYLAGLNFEDIQKKLDDKVEWSGAIPDMKTTLERTAGEMGRILPQNTPVYSGPIVILNDSRSASGGDFVPKILQSNKRAIVIGSTSAGLGGPVIFNQPSLPGSEMEMRCTAGECVASDGNHIEQIGVVPNVVREIKASDLLDGFRLYTNTMLGAALSYFGGSTPAEIQNAISGKIEFRDPALGTRWQAALDEIKGYQTKELAAQQLPAARRRVENGKNYSQMMANLKAQLTGMPGPATQTALLPIPEELMRDDAILRSLREKNAVINRLEQMLTLPAYRSGTSRKLVQTTLASIRSTDGLEIQFQGGCQAIFEVGGAN